MHQSTLKKSICLNPVSKKELSFKNNTNYMRACKKFVNLQILYCHKKRLQYATYNF